MSILVREITPKHTQIGCIKDQSSLNQRDPWYLEYQPYGDTLVKSCAKRLQYEKDAHECVDRDDAMPDTETGVFERATIEQLQMEKEPKFERLYGLFERQVDMFGVDIQLSYPHITLIHQDFLKADPELT